MRDTLVALMASASKVLQPAESAIRDTSLQKSNN